MIWHPLFITIDFESHHLTRFWNLMKVMMWLFVVVCFVLLWGTYHTEHIWRNLWRKIFNKRWYQWLVATFFRTFHEFKYNFENLFVPLSEEWSDSKKLDKLNIQVVSVIWVEWFSKLVKELGCLATFRRTMRVNMV